MLLLRCPQCKQTMKYQATDNKPVEKKVKRCVYCGKNFKIRQNVEKIL